MPLSQLDRSNVMVGFVVFILLLAMSVIWNTQPGRD